MRGMPCRHRSKRINGIPSFFAVKSAARLCPGDDPSRPNLPAWSARPVAAPAMSRPAVLTVEPQVLLEGRKLSSTHPILGVDDSAATSAEQERRANDPQGLASSG